MPTQTQGHTQGDFLNKSELMRAGAQANPEVPGVQELLFPFSIAIEDAKAAQIERALQRAQSQDSSRKLEVALATVSDIYSRIRRLVQAFYGPRSEKLTEFGLQPLRPAQKAKPDPKAPEQTPPEPDQSATQAATPAADSIIN